MRNRSNSGVRLDYYQRLVNRTLLRYQNPATGLFPAGEDNNHAWVRDNVYSIQAVWGLALAYRKNADLDEDRAKAFELEQSVVKLMQGLLRCMIMQVDKLEMFKKFQSSKCALHAKYCSQTGKTVVGDDEWGHLQIDATSIFLLMLAQMTASGLQIIYSLDEVAFVQNLVFYIQTAYRTPDYGIWERGDKTNQGLPELNSSSIGMAKAALESINELDLFGARGGPSSVIHVLPDEAQQCQAILHSMLPRESNSKEIDAALLTVISYPAFACDDVDLIDKTRSMIQEKLQGRYGCCRFLRDGYKTAREDPKRLHYDPGELTVFENIECEWPLFFTYFILDALLNNNYDQCQLYKDKLDSILLKTEGNLPLVPELYMLPFNKIDLEIQNPGSQNRKVIGKVPYLWAQSLYILGRLMDEGFVSAGELDPLNRRLVAESRPDVVVQVVILAQDQEIQRSLHLSGIEVQTIEEVYPIKVYPARVLSHIYSFLGKNKRLGLTGRPSTEIGLLATSKLYMLQDQILAFVPQFFDQNQFYLPLDLEFLVDRLKTDVEFLSSNWKQHGRPIVVFPVTSSILDQKLTPPNSLLGTIKKLQNGYISGIRVHLGSMEDFLSTSCITKLSFIRHLEDENQEEEVKQSILRLSSRTRQRHILSESRRSTKDLQRRTSVHGIMRRSLSIHVDSDSQPELYADLKTLGSQQTSDDNGSKLSSPMSPKSDSELKVPSYLKIGVVPDSSYSGSPKLSRKVGIDPNKNLVEIFGNVDISELLDTLQKTENLIEQTDIIHYLYIAKGLDWDTAIGGDPCTVKNLLKELYEKAGHGKQWWLIRHTAGMLRKRVEDLALVTTDLLVRQKQLSIGLPPDREQIILSPLPPEELSEIIFKACGEDVSTASLTQEILIYLAMFIRTEPKLFNEMLRLRVGLIIQVMAAELARTLSCSGDQASEYLLNLSPFELKTLLHHILSGKEFLINFEMTDMDNEQSLMIKTKEKQEEVAFARLSRSYNQIRSAATFTEVSIDVEDEKEPISDRQGQWMRRRRLDGALNRVPLGFYPKVWKVLEKCFALSIEGHLLQQNLTMEMTPGEFKFALQVERVLNMIPQPEYRQLLVEGLMVLTLLIDSGIKNIDLTQVIYVDRLVHDANSLFVIDQKIPNDVLSQCEGAAGICLHFYDSAPSGRFGTMSYLCRALGQHLKKPGDVECTVS